MGSDYYYGYYVCFDVTGVPEVDAVLEAVANACRASHHTENWRDDWFNDGETCEKKIQDAAVESASLVAEKDARIAALTEELERVKGENSELQVALLDVYMKVEIRRSSVAKYEAKSPEAAAIFQSILPLFDDLIPTPNPKEPT